MLRAGRIGDARTAIQNISIRTLPRNQRAEFARCCLRAGIAELGLKALVRYVRDHSTESTSEERAVYAGCLNSVGGALEARALLDTETDVSPWTLLYQAYVSISMWDYRRALKTLNQLQQSNLHEQFDSYVKQVLSVNRLASLIVEEQWSEAESQLAELKLTLPANGGTRLQGNLRELEIQLSVGIGDLKRAETLLADSSQSEGLDRLYFEKWKAIFDTVKSPSPSADRLFQVLSQAKEQRRWEAIRDLEMRIAMNLKSLVFFKRVYYATPWPEYKKRLVRSLEDVFPAVTIDAEFNYHLMPLSTSDRTHDDAETWMQISVGNGELPDGTNLKPGFRDHRLLQALSSDLFRDHAAGSIFNLIFPDEFYNPFTSPTRVHHAIGSLRDKLTKSGSQLEIEETDGKYRLSPTLPLVMVLSADQAIGKRESNTARLKNIFGDATFQVEEVARHLKIHPKTAQRLLREGTQSGEINKTGSARATRYSLTGNRKAEAA